MEPIIVRVDERLEAPGESITVSGTLDLSSYEMGGRTFTLPDGASYNLVLTNAGDGILATGILHAHIEGVCDRCLDPAAFDVSAEVDEYYLFEEPEEAFSEDEEDDVDYSLISDDDTIDLSEALLSALLMETPYIVLCRPDCKGLCPICGANLNEGDCGCAKQQEEKELEESPFAVLRNLQLGEDESNE